MREQKRLKSLDEFKPLPWHDRHKAKSVDIALVLGVTLALSAGAAIGIWLFDRL